MARAKTRKRTAKKKPAGKTGSFLFLAREVSAVIVTAGTCFLLFALCSFEPIARVGCVAVTGEPCAISQNLMGPVGHVVATALFGVIGFASIGAVFLLLFSAIELWKRSESSTGTNAESLQTIGGVTFGVLSTLVVLSALCAIWFGEGAGGLVGRVVSAVLTPLFGSFGSGLILFCTFFVVLQLAVRSSLGALVSALLTTFRRVGGGCLYVLSMLAIGVVQVVRAVGSGLSNGLWNGLGKALKAVAGGISSAFAAVFGWIGLQLAERAAHRREIAAIRATAAAAEPRRRERRQPSLEPVTSVIANEEIVVVKHQEPELDVLPREVEYETQEEIDDAGEFLGYQPPSYELLEPKSKRDLISIDEEILVTRSKRIQEKLADFNVQGRVTHVHPGPVITMYEFEPAAGVKVAKVVGLQDDLAMALRASSVRIIAPLPQRGAVGIEIPNDKQEIVRLRELLGGEELEAQKSKLTVPLGKDTFGKPVFADIATMPHLLLAGATGTGKSVSINALLISLLYRAHPSELQLILIDPKILELSVYEGIPHLKVPVVSDPRKAKAVLEWAVKEMDRRYRLLKNYGVRNIDGFNDMLAESEGDLEQVKRDRDPVTQIIQEDKPLPKIVIVIDELADLMLMSKRDVEELITRLAQKARAAGIHLVLATQRPSVDVITGLIKANFPARISFRVSSRIDSRTILDSMGAERLIGKGDMLFLEPGAHRLRRIHGAFVSDREVRDVTKALRESCLPNYDQEILELCEKALEDSASSQEPGEDDFVDPLYDKALNFVLERGKASTSMVQRQFRIGYNRAARIVDMMEREGIVGPMDGAKPRSVIVSAASNDE